MKPRYLPTLLLLFCAYSPEDELEHSVLLFWDALANRDKASALLQVHPEDLNNFLYRSEGQVNSWKLEHIERASEKEASVVVTVNRQLKPKLARDLQVKYSWVKTDQGWKIRIPSRQEAIREAYTAIIGEASMSPRLDVGPETIRIYAISPNQPGVITIRNGLQTPVQLLRLEFDSERFELLDSVDVVEAGSIESIRLLFIGKEEEENLTSEATLRLREGEETHQYTIPIIYNFMNDLLRWAKKQTKKKP